MWQIWFYSLLLMTPACFVKALDVVNIAINSKVAVAVVDKMFIGVTLDCSEFGAHWKNFNFTSNKLQTLLKNLSPAYLRVSGSSAEWLFFDKPLPVLQASGIRPRPNLMTKQDVVNLVTLTRDTDSRLLFGLNLQLRFGQQWNPSQAIELLEFCIAHGFENDIDLELGNEPDDYSSSKGQIILNGQQIGNDFVILRKILDHYPGFSNSFVIGPDVGGPFNRRAPDIIKGVINTAGSFLKAVTFHHYYFKGPTATYKDYLDPTHFIHLTSYINQTKSIVSESAYPHLPLWLGETSDAYNSGTVNVSDRFVSGFLWLDKLGLAARGGVTVVMRQTLFGGNYALLDTNLNPNPDYWLTLLHHTFVGQTVLEVTATSENDSELTSTRLYAHCTSERSGKYKAGAVTVFGLNISPSVTSQLVFTDSVLKSQPIDVYILSSENDDVLSSHVILNGQQVLKMVDDRTLPELEPLHMYPGQPLELPSLSFGFFVFPNANFSLCF